MKAIRKLKSAPGLWIEEMDIPVLQDHEVLVKVHSIAICGTDLHIYRWDTWAQSAIPIPLTIGHEFMGEISALGKNTTHLRIGDRVSGEGHIACLHCRNCREGKQHLCPNTQGIGIHKNGAFAEYLIIPASNIIPIPHTISDDVATLLDPLGNAIHTALSFDLIGEDVLITGAGPIGMMAAAVAKHIGAKNIVITDPNDYRLNLALKLGATHAINNQERSFPDLVKELKSLGSFTVGLEMSGKQEALHLLLETLNYGGSLALLGIPEQDIAVDCHKIIFKGLTLKGIYGRKMYETWDKMLDLLQGGLDISTVITHHFKATEFQKAFDCLQSGKAAKILLHW